MKTFGSSKGDARFEPFCEWGGHRTNEQSLLQLAAKPVEKNLCQKELQHWPATESQGFGIRRAETSWGSNYWAWFKLCPVFSQVQEMGWKEAKYDRLYVWLFRTPSCKQCLFFPYIPAWNHTLVVCFVISFGAERRQENFLLDGLKGSVLYTTWVTRTMSNQSAVKWKKVTAQSERDEFSHLASGKRQAWTSPVREQPQVTGSKQLRQRWKHTAWFLLNLAEALLLRLVSSYQGN